MKKILVLLASAAIATTAMAQMPKAMYVKTGDTYDRYNFGVVDDMKFSLDGKTLTVTGYDKAIDLDKIDYITFEAPRITTLTPAAQKQKMIEIGEEFYAIVADYADQNADLLRLFDTFYNYASNYQWHEEHWDIYRKNAIKLTQALKKVACLNPSAAPAVMAASNEIWKADDFYGVYRIDKRAEDWKRVNNAVDYIELQFPVENSNEWYSICATPTGTPEDWVTTDFTVRVPNKVNVQVKKGETLMLEANVITKADNAAKTVNTLVDIDIPKSKYHATNQWDLTNSLLTNYTKATIGDKTVAEINVKISGVALTDYEKWKEDVENADKDQEYYDEVNDTWVWIEGNVDEILVNHFLNARATADFIGRLQVRGSLGAVGKVYNNALDVDTEYDYDDVIQVVDKNKGTVDYYHDDMDKVRRQTDYFNNYCDIAFSYDNDGKTQGYMTFETVEEGDEPYITQGYYDQYANEYVDDGRYYSITHYDGYTKPMLTFADGTSYDFESFFNETDFDKLIDDYYAIIDAYETIIP